MKILELLNKKIKIFIDLIINLISLNDFKVTVGSETHSFFKLQTITYLAYFIISSLNQLLCFEAKFLAANFILLLVQLFLFS